MINNPELKCPNIETASIADEKFTKYLFGGNNREGLIKGELISKRLGYDITNYKEFVKEIRSRSVLSPSKYLSANTYGDKYEQRIVMYGLKGKPSNVLIGWKVKDGKTHLVSIYIKEVKDDEN